ncbi:glycosyltransferase family 4 protein [Vibrio sp. JPW-9-11-11]|uniref:glycosyltransferase family 4 protein n=1 Tax=Vibrio sp. JPW-9-11-11 TaxID=1416532 RepID=UPI001593C15C|nr:glycosyltransferase family 4 protein [Vibrio sp. JPW-9-11-11]NVD08485.1 glycosyltransferase family 4 protein [Vibrio sp. JPW-9-11-11]
MNVAYVCSDRGVPIFGTKGCSLHIQEVCQALSQYQISFSLFAASLGGQCPSQLHPNVVYQIAHQRIKDRAQREQADIEDNQATLELLANAGPFDFVYERYSLWSHAGMTYANAIGVPGILEVNAPLIEEQARYRGLVDHASAVSISEQCFSHATHILAVSKEVAHYLNQFPQARGKIQLLPNGVNVERFSNCRSHAITKRPFTIGFVGTLKPWHGVESLIEAFAQLYPLHSHIRLMIVGDGPQRPALQAQIDSLDLNHVVQMTGAVSPAEMPDYLSKMDIGAAPYPDNIEFYFSPLKVFEYMAAQLPVVASRTGQIGDVIEHKVHGLLYSPGDVQQLIECLDYLITHPNDATLLGKQARYEAEQKHSWHQRVGQLLNWLALPTRVH